MNETYMNGSKEKKNKNALKFIGPALIAVLSLILLGIGIQFVVAKLNTDELKGVWTSDQVTFYQFDGKGKGTLILPNSQYEFTYQLNESTLSIDYESDKALDAVYTVEINGKKINLSQDEEGKEAVHIQMQKKE